MLDINRVIDQREFCRRRIEKSRERIRLLPEGNLEISKNGKYYTWRSYNMMSGNRIYLPKSSEELAADLAFRLYLEKLIEDDLKEMKALDMYLRLCVQHEHGKVNCSCEQEFNRLLSKRKMPENKEAAKYLESLFVRGTRNLDKCKYPTICGFNVRSKSESIISETAIENGLSIMYEPILRDNEGEFLPDFAIYNPKTGKVYMWEHFGMMDNAEYARKAFLKLQRLYNLGWIMGINLIITTETMDRPFTKAAAQKAIDAMLQC